MSAPDERSVDASSSAGRALPDLSSDHFALFGLPARFELDEAALAPRYRELQAAVHPARFAAAGAAERRWSVQASGRVNDAWRTLSKPLPRATYLLSLHGIDTGAETDTRMDPAFLMEQMELREALAEAESAADPPAALDALGARLRALGREEAVRFAAAADAGDWAAGRDVVRRWQFVEKLRAELGEVEARLEG